MPRISHFEIPSDYPEKAMSFYQHVFGWTFQKFGEHDYWFVNSGDSNEPGINGAIMKKKDPRQPVVNSIMVEDLDAIVRTIENHGGKIVVPKMPFPVLAGWLISPIPIIIFMGLCKMMQMQSEIGNWKSAIINNQ